jgi:hypothetical protein
MGQQRKNKVYSETMDSKTFKLIHIKRVTRSGCCLKCEIRARRGFYFISKQGNDKMRSKFPCWKLTSKKRKQWMDDNLKFKKMDGRYYSSQIIW